MGNLLVGIRTCHYTCRYVSPLQETMDRRASVFLFVLVSVNGILYWQSNTSYVYTKDNRSMKRLWFKYITDLRISILFILLINMLSYCLSGIIPFSCFEGRPKYASHLDHFLLSEEQRSVNAFLSDASTMITLYSLLILVIPFVYNVYKKEWRNVGFMLLIWLSPIAIILIVNWLLIGI